MFRYKTNVKKEIAQTATLSENYLQSNQMMPKKSPDIRDNDSNEYHRFRLEPVFGKKIEAYQGNALERKAVI